MNAVSVRARLEPVCRNVKFSFFWGGLAKAWTWVVFLGIVSFLFRPFLRDVWGYVLPSLIGVAALLALRVIWQTARLKVDPQSIARQIEREFPKLQSLLLAAVEQEPEPAQGRWNFLQLRVINQALTHHRRYGWEQRSVERLFFSHCLHGSSLLALFVVALALRTPAPAGPPAATAKAVTVLPGDITLERGSALMITARFTEDLPTEATLLFQWENGAAEKLGLAKSLDDPVFGTTLASVRTNATYSIRHSGGRTRDFQVTVFDYPALERADAHLEYPTYTKLPSQTIEDTRRISAVEGTKLSYTLRLNKPVVSARLLARTGAIIPVRPKAGSDPQVYETELTLAKNAHLELELVDGEGRTNQVPAEFVLDVNLNQRPALKFVAPRGDQRVSPLEEVSFRAEASDDFGIESSGLGFSLAGQPARLITLATNASANEKLQLAHVLAFEALQAVPDQLVSYYLWADDYGPDGKIRRTHSDMFFAEVRSFDEIFREGQSGQGQSQSGGGNPAEKMADIQKQIISATWKILNRETGAQRTLNYGKDVEVVRDSQKEALHQLDEMDSPASGRSAEGLQTAQDAMKKAVEFLESAASDESIAPLPEALAQEQAAYDALLKLRSRETQVARGSNSRGGGQGGGRSQQQLNQLELKQSEDRYESESQAGPAQSPEQREQLQILNRLRELAQRQEDLNERLRELQSALAAADTEEERERLRRELKRLREEQQQILADLDEARQRMDRPENKSRMSEARQQLEQTRSNVRRSADELEKGAVSQALSAGTRAERELEKLTDNVRKQSSSQFAENMRQLRSEARELAQKEQELARQIAQETESKHKTLDSSQAVADLPQQLTEQRSALTNLLSDIRQVTEQAESAEPLLYKQLYETLRKSDQDQTEKRLQLAAELFRRGFAPQGAQAEEQARQRIEGLKSSVERAAESILGNETEALRFAERELNRLSEQLGREIAQNRAKPSGGSAEEKGAAASPGQGQDEAQDSTNRLAQANGQGGERPPDPSQNQAGAPGQSQAQPGPSAESAQTAQAGQSSANGGPGSPPSPANQSPSPRPPSSAQTAQNSPGQSPGSGQEQSRGGSGESPGTGPSPSLQAQSNSTPRPGTPGQPGSANRSGAWFQGTSGGGTGGEEFAGPITTEGFGQWSDRLRDVEETLDDPELRSAVARARDRARSARIELKRHSKEPQWEVLQSDVLAPLVEVRSRIQEELARRDSSESLAPIDRDPVPPRYSELVRRYYEELSRSR